MGPLGAVGVSLKGIGIITRIWSRFVLERIKEHGNLSMTGSPALVQIKAILDESFRGMMEENVEKLTVLLKDEQKLERYLYW